MTRRRLGCIRATAIGPVTSVGARTSRKLTRPADSPGAGWRAGFQQDVGAYQDTIVGPAVPEAVR
jgi:hypothetical protein